MRDSFVLYVRSRTWPRECNIPKKGWPSPDICGRMEGRGGSVRPSAADRLPGPGAGATPPPGCFFVGRSGRAMRTTLIVLGALLLGGALFGPGRAAAREPEPAPQKTP